MKEYNTKQKESLLSFLKDNSHKCFTTEELLINLPDVGKSTLYRLLAHLEEEGMLSCSLKGRCKTYSYRKGECEGHLHLVCKDCGCYTHLSHEATAEILRIIAADTGFDASLIDWEIRGRCKECLK